MPELPEIQALAERLDARLAGKLLSGADVLQFSALKTVEPAPESVAGERLASAGRRGKFLVLDFTATRVLVHLSQSGRVDVEDPPRAKKPRGSVVRFRFDGAHSLLVREFGKERKAGWWVLAAAGEGPLAKLGPDPFSDEFSAFIEKTGDKRRMHTILRDQRSVAGIGRGYSDDILHASELSPYSTAASLGKDERRRLIDETRRVLDEALAVERRRTGGLPAKLGDHFGVHGRHGLPCPRCGSDLRRVSFGSHEITYCPQCQTGGKILADRRLSRLIR